MKNIKTMDHKKELISHKSLIAFSSHKSILQQIKDLERDLPSNPPEMQVRISAFITQLKEADGRIRRRNLEKQKDNWNVKMRKNKW